MWTCGTSQSLLIGTLSNTEMCEGAEGHCYDQGNGGDGSFLISLFPDTPNSPASKAHMNGGCECTIDN